MYIYIYIYIYTHMHIYRCLRVRLQETRHPERLPVAPAGLASTLYFSISGYCIAFMVVSTLYFEIYGHHLVYVCLFVCYFMVC